MWDCLIKDGLKQELKNLRINAEWYGKQPNEFGLIIDLVYNNELISSTCVNLFDEK